MIACVLVLVILVLPLPAFAAFVSSFQPSRPSLTAASLRWWCCHPVASPSRTAERGRGRRSAQSLSHPKKGEGGFARV